MGKLMRKLIALENFIVISHVSVNNEANVTPTFKILRNRKCEINVFPTSNLERINEAVNCSLVRKWENRQYYTWL